MGGYRSSDGEAAVRAWCEARLQGRERTTVTTDLGDTSLVGAGTGAGDPTILLVPGTNLNAATSLGLVDALAAHPRVVVVDLPGQPGLSTAAGPSGDRMTGYGAWLDEVVDGLDGPLVLVGHSMGAAAVLAATPSSRIAGVVLVDPAGFTRPAVGMRLLAAFLAWMVRPSPTSSSRLLRGMLAPRSAPADELVDWFTLIGRHCRSSGAPGPTPDATVERWRSTPLTVVVGEHDAFFPPRKLGPAVRRLLGVDPVVVADTGHLLPDEQPAVVVDAVLGLA